MARRALGGGWRVARLVDMGGGLVTAVSPDLLNDNEAQFAQCVDLSQKGTIRPALGRRDRYASPFSQYPVRGMYAYYKKDGTSRLLMYSGGALYYDLPHFVRTFDSQPEWDSGVHDLDSAASPGDLKLLAAPTSAFARSTVAYNDDGTQVAANTPRYKAGKYGNGVWIEEGTQNLLKSASFEVYTGANGVADGWVSSSYATVTASFAVDTTIHRPSGAKSQKIAITASTGAGRAFVYQQIAGNAGVTYTLSAYAQGSATGTGVGMVVLRFLDSAGAILAQTAPTFTPTASWQRISATATAPAGTTTIEVQVRAQAQAAGDTVTVYFDDAQLEAKPYPTSIIFANDTTTQPSRAADNLSYTLPKPLPVRNAGCLWWKPDVASANLANRTYWLAVICAAGGGRRYQVGYEGDKRFRLYKSADGVTLYAVASSVVSFSAGDSIFIAWLDDPVAGYMKLWYGINGAALTEVSLANTVQISDAQKVYLGCRDVPGYECDGVIDDPQLYSVSTVAASGGAVDTAFWNAIYTSTTAQAWGEHTLFHAALDGALTTDAAEKGIWVSPVIDVSTVQDKASGAVSYGATVPANTSLAIETRSSPDGATWSDWYGLGAGGVMNSPPNNYVQVRARLATTDIAAANPVLSWLKVVFDAAPAASQLVTGLASEAEAFFGTLNDICIIVNGADAPRKYDGATVALLGGSPPAAQYIAVFQNRVWLASSNANPSRVWFSELLDPETWPALNFIDVAPDDGDRISGLVQIGDVLVVMKTRSTWLVLGDSPSNFQVRCVNPAVGSIAPRSLCNMDGKLVFAADTGVYLSDMTGFAVMTERIRPDWEAFNVRRLAQTLAAYANHMLYVFAPRGTSITNSGGLVYDTIRQAWLTLPFGASCACMFRELGHQVLLFGDPTQGQVFSLDSTSDRGAVVPFAWESKAFDFGARESLKLARRVLLQVRPNGVAGQLRCYLRPDQGALKGPATVNYPATSEIVTLQFIAGAIGLGPFKTLSVRIENATKDARPEIHSIAIEHMVVGVQVD